MVIMLVSQVMQGQVLISLLFGDKLNSPTLKFGLDGGANFSTISNLSGARYRTGFNLGFYFDFLLKKDKPWYLHTGVLVKSALGANGIAPYHLNNADSTALDSLFINGTVDRKLSYFNVPVLIRYSFKKKLFIELGPMLSLGYKANDIFTTEIENKDDLSFNNDVKDQFVKFDIGGMVGIGYAIEAMNGMNFGLRYYYGFMDIVKNNSGAAAQRNSSFYLFASLPIGAGDKAKAKNAEKAKEKKLKQEQKMREQQLEKEKK
jgi:hypothetical protein